ncbi:MlaD family protein [Nocardia sp. NPDC127526]|uniref:MlaD family protein n=1 Tax=Nocardia sp. NPDC127526 TaxID=3345393 RepID=UPI00362A0822
MNVLREHKTLVSNLALVGVMLVGVTYLLVSVARVKPPESTYAVTVHLAQSGGLQPGGDVTWRGYRVGKVKSVDLIDGGAAIAAVAEIDDKYRIPADATIAVGALSGAGEQYLDFRPNTDSAPYLADGQVIRFDPERISTPTPIWNALENSDALFAQIDPDKLGVILNQLDIAFSGGPDQMRALVDGVSLATAGLDNLLPQTTNLIENLRLIADTTSHAQPDLGTLTANSSLLAGQLDDANAELRELLDSAPAHLRVADEVLDRNQDPIQSLVTNMAAIVKAALLRTPALRALFPSLLVGTAAMGAPAHHNEFHTVVDAWLRPWCEYPVKPSAHYVVQDGTLARWSYCDDPPPGQQIRGSSNAPRPDVPDNGANAPSWADPRDRTLPPIR